MWGARFGIHHGVLFGTEPTPLSDRGYIADVVLQWTALDVRIIEFR
jgi:hypothetical protein